MQRAPVILLLLSALLQSADAQSAFFFRKTVPASTMEIQKNGMSFVMPNGSMNQSLYGSRLVQRSAQDAMLNIRPEGFPLFVRYAMGAQVEDAFSNGRIGGFGRTVGLTQRPALVAQWEETSSLEAAMESQARFDQAMHSETARRFEFVLQTTKLPGLNFSTRIGRAWIQDMAGWARMQTYASLTAEQKLPFLPIRLGFSPGVAQEESSAGEQQLTNWSSAIMWDASPQTTVSVNMTEARRSALPGLAASTFRSYSSQLEQRLDGKTTVRLGGGVEEQWTDVSLASKAVFLGAESTVTILDAFTGAMQIRQRAVQMLDAAGTIPETVLSFSLSGAF